MTIEAILDMLLQHGSLGLFAAYLIFESRRIRTQFSTDLAMLAAKDDKEIAALREQYEGREAKWQQVVAKYDDQIVGDRASLQSRIEKLSDKLGDLAQKQDHMMIQIEGLAATINEIKIREIAQGRR